MVYKPFYSESSSLLFLLHLLPTAILSLWRATTLTMPTTSNNPDEWLEVLQPQKQDTKPFTLPDRPDNFQQHVVTDHFGTTHSISMFMDSPPGWASGIPPSVGYSRQMDWSIDETGRFSSAPEPNIWGFGDIDGNNRKVHFERHDRASTKTDVPRQAGAHGQMTATYTHKEVLLEGQDHNPPLVSIILILINLADISRPPLGCLSKPQAESLF
jgi:hypothetical protein